MKKAIALLLAVLLALGALSACGGGDAPEAESTPTPDVTGEPAGEDAVSPDEGDGNGESGEAAQTPAPRDVAAIKSAFAPDTVMMTVNGLEVNWNEYFYWMYSSIEVLEAYYGPVEDFDAPFNGMEDGVSYAELVLTNTEGTAVQYRAVDYLAAQRNISLSEESRAAAAAQLQSDITNFGGGDEAAFWDYLSGLYIDREMYDCLNNTAFLFLDCFQARFGVGGEKCTDEEVADYAARSNYIQAKHVLFSTNDENGNPLPEEERATKRAAAEAALEALRAAEDKNAKMDELMLQSDDPGAAYYPGGYVFGYGKMVAEFETAAFALEPGELSDIVEGPHGFHIILRVPLDPDAVTEYRSETEKQTLRYEAAQSLFNAEMDAIIMQVEVVRSPELESLDLQALLNK